MWHLILKWKASEIDKGIKQQVILDKICILFVSYSWQLCCNIEKITTRPESKVKDLLKKGEGYFVATFGSNNIQIYSTDTTQN